MLDRDRYWDCLDQAVQASSGGRLEEALAWLDEALRANPRGAEAHNTRGEILWDHGRPEEALVHFNRAIELDPTLWGAHLNRIELLIEEFGECERALELADRLLGRRLEPSVEAEVFYLKAKALFYLDDLPGALFLVRRAVRVQPDMPVGYAFEGQILFELGRFEEAAAALERALALDPESAHAVYHLALVREHLGQDEQARELFEEATRLAPEQYPPAGRFGKGEIVRAARAAIRSLPPRAQRLLERAPIEVEELPSLEAIVGEEVSPQVLALVDANRPRGPVRRPEALRVRKIRLFRRNLERAASTPEELESQIRSTLVQELGFHLGLGEEELRRLGLA